MALVVTIERGRGIVQSACLMPGQRSGYSASHTRAAGHPRGKAPHCEAGEDVASDLLVEHVMIGALHIPQVVVGELRPFSKVPQRALPVDVDNHSGATSE